MVLVMSADDGNYKGTVLALSVEEEKNLTKRLEQNKMTSEWEEWCRDCFSGGGGG